MTSPTSAVAIGPYTLPNRAILAPMAGVTDRPFRQLCRRLGAGWVVGEMVTSDPSLWNTRKSRQRMDHRGEPAPRVVQIAGGDADMLAEAARLNAELGAEVIDINMGCPAKKVCNKAAGSALMRDERLVAEIVNAVVAAVDIPVTLKIRTGWCADSNNAVRVAGIAEDAGIQALAVHGRHRQQRYAGEAEYDTIAAVKSRVGLPVFANGDIDTPEKAARVLAYTRADALMIGRGAQGNPWIFQQINRYLDHGTPMAAPTLGERARVLGEHLAALHEFYGDYMGVRIARKHLGWYLAADTRFTPEQQRALKKQFNALETPATQFDWMDTFTVPDAAARLSAKGGHAA
ncbi:tRNA dihydrouridine synthase DusB [Halomonas garicola]|uniref:tRNA dihydrouridine synthase DusB n=1 Tax=Halomonas garicola TaxID=1690008 RepID=UPI0028A2C1DA|nr:tRNA dihydrouridine synthase DusB [Halomonas garicola]